MLVGAITLEALLPVGIIAAILFVVTVILAIADKLLVSYGDCKITVKQEDETKEFTVEGGGKLLSALIDNGMKIPASCAGRGSCGYCKVNVQSGGGQVLPTEEVFIGKDEARAGARLACQVKVKNDIELFVPDLITTVKSMVKGGTFDTRLKWKFRTTGDTASEDVPEKVKKLDRVMRAKAVETIEKYKGIDGAVMPVLREMNASFKYLPKNILLMISQEMDIPLSMVFRIATFYNAFSLKPRGEHIITVCMGTACHVKGAAGVLEKFEEELGIKAGQTTQDMQFTLEAVRCIGCCGLAPVLTVDENVHGLMTKKKVPELLERYKGVAQNVEA